MCAWYKPMVETVLSIHDVEVCRLLAVSTSSAGITREEAEQDAWFQQQARILQVYENFVINLAAERVWAQIPFHSTLPQLLASVFHPDPACAAQGMRSIREICSGVLLAEQKVLSGDEAVDPFVKTALSRILADLAWHKTQIGRETMAVCKAGDWSPNDVETRRQGFSLWGAPVTTKFHLEDAFAHASTVVKRHGKDSKLGKLLGCSGAVQLESKVRIASKLFMLRNIPGGKSTST